MMQVGAHISVAKGYAKALEYALSVGCECAQIFAKSPRQWAGAAIDEEAAARFVDARREVGFGPVFTHTAYLINLSTSDAELRAKSVDALADELRRGSMLGASGVVTHIGNDPEDDWRAASIRAGRSIALAMEAASAGGHHARVLLENTAGAGRTFGGSFEELDATIDASGLSAELVGVCFDTCHGFAYGMELDNSNGWRLVAEGLGSLGGGGRLGLIHANDCKFGRGEHKDRHEWIGEGHIGDEGFAAMMCTPGLESVPVVTEMPGETPEKDAVNVARLLAMRSACQESQ